MQKAFADPDVVGVKGICQTRQQGLVARFTQAEYDDKHAGMRRYRTIDFIDAASAGYRRSVFLENGGFDPTLHTVEDVDLSFRLAGQGYRLIFIPAAVVYHRHPDSVLAYARRKYTYGYWRTRLYRRYPHKMARDSRTPTSQKLQLVLTFLLGVTLVCSPFLPELQRWALVLLLLFLASAAPFCLRSLRRDPAVGVIAPAMLGVRAVAVDLGLMVGVAHLGLARFKARWVPQAIRRRWLRSWD